MKTVYMFWIGDRKKIESMVSAIEMQGFKVVVGPSKEDDKYLSDNFRYYKQSKEQGVWSFCSDVWRFYILAKNAGLYIDANEKVGENFYQIYEFVEKFDLVAVRGSSHTIGSSLFYSSGKLSNIFQEALDQYKKFDYDYIRLFPIGPHVITWVLRNKFTPGFDFEEKNGIAFLPYPFIRDETKYKKVGSASWSKGFNAAVYSQGVEDNFVVHRKLDNKLTRYFYESKEFPKVNLYSLRNEFDCTDSKVVLFDLEKIYKNSNQKKKVFQRLIWSKLYRLFARKNKHF